MECREVREYLPAHLEGAEGPRSLLIDDHLATCSSGCPAEFQKYKDLAAGLRMLAEQHLEAPAWLEEIISQSVLERSSRLATVRAARDRMSDPKVVAGAMVAAGVAGALIFRGVRRRKHRSVRRRLRSALTAA